MVYKRICPQRGTPSNHPAKLTLYSLNICPFVQRAAIALLEKGVPFERVFIDTANKPEGFQKISPLGNVPVLAVRQPDGSDAAIFESLVICEYIEETQPGRKLHPADPLARARHRGWMEFASSIISAIVGIERAADEEALRTNADRIAARFARIEQELGAGPYFDGAAFSLVDAVHAPIFRYFDVFDSFRDLGVFADLPKVSAWRKALAERPSVRQAVTADYHDEMVKYLEKRGSCLLRAGR